eukprot:TRINITY_DN1937_c0_g1_i1.p1 TRINITY_DN1937_c0_g1~~TRINITY_DN1937_c0_g1_i1.p1  ORF type:complete len:114 (-),score=14.88 TRINITY_DN1937_c0_g1_i1:100-441(-)
MSEGAILNLDKKDPFAEADEQLVGSNEGGYVHIRTKQRNTRKAVTTIENLPPKLNLTKLIKAFKKDFNCNGALKLNTPVGPVIQLTGDQRNRVVNFLSSEGIVKKENIKVHGA